MFRIVTQVMLVAVMAFSVFAAVPVVTLTWKSGAATPEIAATEAYKIYRVTKPCSKVIDPKTEFKVIADRVIVREYVDNAISMNTRDVCYTVTAYWAAQGPATSPESGFSNTVGKSFNIAPSAPSNQKFR